MQPSRIRIGKTGAAATDLKVEVTRFAMSTAAMGNTQDITISGFGTPKAAIFIMSGALTDDTVSATGTFCIGFTDGTNENAVAVYGQDNVTTSAESRRQTAQGVITSIDSAGSKTSLFSFNSWITDGVRLDISDATAFAYLVTCILIGGDDVASVHCGYKDDLGTGTSAVDINTVGFEPDLVFMTCGGNSGVPGAPSAATEAVLSFGVGHNDGSDTQRAIGFGAKDNNAGGLTNITVFNDSITAQVYNNAIAWKGVIGSYDASGFSITPSASAANDIVFYLALKFNNDPSISLFDMEWPTSGNYAETGPGFEPTFGLIGTAIGPTSRNAVNSVWAEQSVASFAAFNGSAVYTVSTVARDGFSTTNRAALSSDQLRILDDSNGDEVVASSYALDADGWDFTLSTNPGIAALGWGLAISGVASVPPEPSDAVPYGHHQLDNIYQAIAASRLNGVLQ